MPITVHAYRSLENLGIRTQLERLYDTSPEFGDGQDAMQQLEQDLQQYTTVYTAEFNSKIIGAIWSTGQGESRVLEYIVVHPANRGRGIAAKFVKQVTDLERKKGNTRFVPGCAAIHRILVMYELI